MDENDRRLWRNLMTTRSKEDLERLLDELGLRCLDLAVRVWRDFSLVGERDSRWNRDSFETPTWVLHAAALRWPDAFFRYIRTSHVADAVTFTVAQLDDERAPEYLLGVVTDVEPGASWFDRGQAALALAAWREVRAIEPLIAMLSATDDSEVFAAASALEVLADDRALPTLRALTANLETSERTRLCVQRTIARLEQGEAFPVLRWYWVTVAGGRPPEYLVAARSSDDAHHLVEAFTRSPRALIEPVDPTNERVFDEADVEDDRYRPTWSRPAGMPVSRGIHRPWEVSAHNF